MKETWACRDGPQGGTVHVLGNLGGTGVLAQIVAEAIDVESQLLGVAHEILGTEGGVP
jgi:hypothetical protein